MKKTLKIILPVFLALVVLASVVWYLLVYDQNFTRDLLLSQARFQENHGNHSIASWLYGKAYSRSSNDPDVAIELAEQYKSIGNFTKAEFTLTNAISDGGSVELYIALSKTYVQQDKLLDAVAMLENVSDPEIKAALESFRPSVPTTNQAPGFYTQYISVALEAASGTLYVNTNGEYPSLNDPPYTDPITLSAGETTLYALAVGENGLVSPLGIFGYTVGGVVEPVTLTDPAIESSIRSILQVSADHTLYTDDLWTITEFTVPEGAESLDDLAGLIYLKTLTVNNTDLDLSPISGLNQLETLSLTGCKPTSELLEAIAAFPNLTSLDLSNCKLSTIAGLEKAVSLEILNLEDNTVRNLDVLSNMNHLKTLHLAHNAVVSLNALSGLTSLQTLDVSYNALTDLSALSGCTSLIWLNASHNSITSIGNLNRLTALGSLDLSYNSLTDITPVGQLSNLIDLDLSDNQLTDLSPLSSLTNMMTFRFANNQVESLPDWSEDSALVTIDGSNNLLTSLDALGGLQQLNHVFMDYNKLTSVDILSTCPRLMQVNVYGNNISNVSALTDMSIVINYTPVTGLAN